MERIVTSIAICSLLIFAAGCRNRNEKIPFSEIDSMPLIDVHCHADLFGTQGTDDIIRLIQQERMNYVLMLCENYEEVIAKVRPVKDNAGVVLYYLPGMKDCYRVLDSVTGANRDLIRGYKLHPTMKKHEISGVLLDSLFLLANKYNVLVVTHTDSLHSQASKYKPLLEKYPDTKLILYHAAPAAEAFELVNAYNNVYIDISFTAWGSDFQQKALKAVGKEKILFGIDSPLGFPSDSSGLKPHFRQAAREAAAFYNFNREIIEAVFFRNATRLLSIDVE